MKNLEASEPCSAVGYRNSLSKEIKFVEFGYCLSPLCYGCRSLGRRVFVFLYYFGDRRRNPLEDETV